MWDVLIIIILFYTATYATYRIAFVDDKPGGFGRFFEILVDVIFISDIFVTFLTPIERYDGSLVYDHRKIAISYLSGAFWIDFIASFPTEVIENSILSGNDPTAGKNNQANKLLRLARLQRLYRLLRILRIVKLIKIAKYNAFLANFIERLNINPGLSRVYKLLIVALMITHLMACFWFLCAKLNDFGANTWVVNTENIDEKNTMLYFVSMYWAF